MQVFEVPHVVAVIGTTRADMIRSRSKHVVIDNQLGAPLEEVSKLQFPPRRSERVWTIHQSHRQAPTARVQSILCPSGFLFFLEERPALLLPLLARHDIGVIHDLSPVRWLPEGAL